MKTCTRCRQTKPLEEFYRNAKCRGGHLTQCRACVAIVAKRRKVWKQHRPARTTLPLETFKRLEVAAKGNISGWLRDLVVSALDKGQTASLLDLAEPPETR